MADFILRDRRAPGMVLHPSTECALAAMQDIKNSLPHRGRVGAASPEAAWRRGMGADLRDSANNAPHLTSPLRGKEIYILDVGCGSGLLSLAALQLWPGARILASDISEKAVADAVENLGDKARVVRADGLDHAQIRAGAQYDLILCNLLAELHIQMAADLKSCLAPKGLAVLSGILAWKLPQVAEAYAALGFEIIEETQVGEWRAVVAGIRDQGSGIK